MHRFHFAPLLALWIALIAALTGCAAPDPGAMRAAAVTSLTRALSPRGWLASTRTIPSDIRAI